MLLSMLLTTGDSEIPLALDILAVVFSFFDVDAPCMLFSLLLLRLLLSDGWYAVAMVLLRAGAMVLFLVVRTLCAVPSLPIPGRLPRRAANSPNFVLTELFL